MTSPTTKVPKKRWIVLAHLFVVIFSCYLTRVAYSTTFIPMGKELGWDLADQGLFLGAFYWTYVFGNWLTIVFGHHSPKKLVLISASLSVLTFVSVPLVANLIDGGWMIFILRLICGLVEGVMQPACAQLLSRWAFESERSFATSIVFSGATTGTVVTLALAPLLITHFTWRGVFYGYTLFNLVWLASFTFFIADDPSTFGRAWWHKCWPSLPLAQSELARLPVAASRHSPVPWKTFLRSRAYWVLICTHCCSNWNLYVLISWLPTYLDEELGFSLQTAGLLACLPYVINVPSGLLFGKLADKLMSMGWKKLTVRKLMQTIALIIPGIALALIGILQPSAPGVIALMCIAVAVASAFLAGFLCMFQDIAPKNTGKIFSFSNGIAQVPGIGVTLVGVQVHSGAGWISVWMTCLAISVIGTIVFVVWASTDPVDVSAEVELQSSSSDTALVEADSLEVIDLQA